MTLRRAMTIATVAGALCAPAAQAVTCPTAPDPGALPTVAALKQSHEFLAKLGVRPTGSATHARYVQWIRQQLATIPGVTTHDLNYKINRWTPRSAKLTMRIDGHTTTVPIADAIPYSHPTGRRGVSAALAYVPADQQITAANSARRIVVRDAPAGSVPYYDLFLPVVSWETYDPGNTINPADNLYGDFINYLPRIADLRAAAAAGAKGIIFVKDRPRRQLVGHYEPYEGEAWKVPGVFLGSDEGKAITDAIAAGKRPTA
ncbi:MAG: hypothetical protein QOG68_1690, partial [Solirubrobacteraceae bacterium]|nr:hypothetical protein [Solirubrobacteraceae bacterium]